MQWGRRRWFRRALHSCVAFLQYVSLLRQHARLCVEVFLKCSPRKDGRGGVRQPLQGLPAGIAVPVSIIGGSDRITSERTAPVASKRLRRAVEKAPQWPTPLWAPTCRVALEVRLFGRAAPGSKRSQKQFDDSGTGRGLRAMRLGGALVCMPDASPSVATILVSHLGLPLQLSEYPLTIATYFSWHVSAQQEMRAKPRIVVWKADDKRSRSRRARRGLRLSLPVPPLAGESRQSHREIRPHWWGDRCLLRDHKPKLQRRGRLRDRRQGRWSCLSSVAS